MGDWGEYFENSLHKMARWCLTLNCQFVLAVFLTLNLWPQGGSLSPPIIVNGVFLTARFTNKQRVSIDLFPFCNKGEYLECSTVRQRHFIPV